MTDVTPPPTPASPAVWEDLIDIFTSPTAVYERRKDDPAFLVPLVILTVLFGVIMLAGWGAMADVQRADATRAVENMIRANPNFPAETAEQMRTNAASGGGMGKYFIALVVPLIVIFVGLYAWGAGKALGAKTTIAQAFMVTTYAFTPKILGAIVGILMTLVLPETMLDGQYRLTLGPGMFLDPDTMKQSTLFFLARFEVTTLWVTALIGIGLKVTGQLPAAKAAIAAAIVFFLGFLVPGGLMMVGEMAQGIR